MSRLELTGSDAPRTRGMRWRLPLLLAVVLVALVAMHWSGIRSSQPSQPAPPAEPGTSTGETVSLAVDFGDGRRSQFDPIAWHAGMTVAELMLAAGGLPEGIRFRQQGSGPAAFLTELGGVANEGAGGRNWTYAVNDRRGDRSFAVYELRPGDRVLWMFAAGE